MKLLANTLLPTWHPYRSLYQLGVDLGVDEKALVLAGVREAGALLSRIQRGIKSSLSNESYRSSGRLYAMPITVGSTKSLF
jgi:hypothetical protein